MKVKRIVAFAVATLAVMALASGCGSKKFDSPLNGKWSYLYNEKTPDFVVRDNGTVTLDKKKYTDCEVSDGFISFKDSNGVSQSIRYKFDKEDKIFLYKEAVYKYAGEGTPDGLIGYWVGAENPNISYEFTMDGTFREDTYIPGYYTVNEEDGTIFCVYNDHYEDTTVYYRMDGNLLYVEYPWPMVRYSK